MPNPPLNTPSMDGEQPPATPQDLEAYIQAHQIQAWLHRDAGHTPTVPAAAQALGVHPDQIVKTLLFEIEKPVRPPKQLRTQIETGSNQNLLNHSATQNIIVISNGERRIDKRALATHFEVGRKRIKLASPAIVLTQLGYPAGGVPPFGHRTRLPVLLDASITRLPATLAPHDEHTFARTRIFAGGGDDRTMLELTVEELLRVTQPVILPLSTD